MKKLYAIKDDKAMLFNPPVVIENDAVATRQFGDAIDADKGVLHAHPEDFSIWFVGFFDDVSGLVTSTDKEGHILQRRLASGSDFAKE